MSRSLDIDYLKQQLSLDPRIAADQIVALRNQQLGLTLGGNQAVVENPVAPQPVASARSAIETIRSQFWTLPLDVLNRKLSEIDLRPYPELATVVEQLQQAAAVRADFPRLAQRLGSDLALFHCVRQSLTMPPRDVAGMKETVMRSLFNGETIRSYKATAQIIREEFPQIYALQYEWFDDILKAKRLGRDTTARNQEFKFGAPIWVFALLFLLLLRGCASLLR